ncbi:MAG TPA: enoyl-CoA hydratase/isomerase family protein [Burkholderiales bacterium]
MNAVEKLTAAGFGAAEVRDWLTSVERLQWGENAPARTLDAQAAAAAEAILRGWSFLEKLPRRSRRTPAERAAGETIVRETTEITRRLTRAYREPIYDALSDGFRRHVRVDDLVYAAAERWPGLVPTRAQVREEAERMLADKDGLEIFQGCFISELLASPRIGLHMVNGMLRPTPEALERIAEFERTGAIDLGYTRVEARGETGYVYFKNPRYLNAEDWESLGPQETAVDLVLLHRGLKMGVLRGDYVDHPRYKGRRVFDAGLNLTKVYHGKLPYLFYIVRDLGLVNKLYRGHALADYAPDLPEETREKPWMAVVEAFAIGGGCQLLLVMDYVLAETGAYFNLPARKEGIIPGAANLRLPRFVGERQARAGIMFDKTFAVDSPEASLMINEVVPRDQIEAAIERVVATAVGSGMVSAAGNRRALRVQTEPIDTFRRYMAVYAYEQAWCHLSEQLVQNLERHWNAKQRRLAEA